jgi:hypothetical protein
LPSAPPVTRTRPSFSSVALCPEHSVTSPPVAARDQVAGSSSVAHGTEIPACTPPAISTMPLLSKVAEYPVRDSVKFPADEKASATGSYTSAYGGFGGCSWRFWMAGIPPKTSTLPLANRMPQWPMRVVPILADVVKLPVNHANLYVNPGTGDVNSKSFTASSGETVPAVTASFKDSRQIVLAARFSF